MKYVIIGAGAAGISAAKTLLDFDEKNQIVLISEDEKAYSRCMLHFVIAGKRDIDTISFVDEKLFDSDRISWISGKKVTELIFVEREVVLEDKSHVSYDKLLIAAGANAVIPPIKGMEHSKNVFVLRNIGDANAIREVASFAKRAVIIGAGLVGLDAASALLSLGLEVTVVEMADRILSLQLDSYSASQYQRVMEDMGAVIYTGVSVVEVKQNRNGFVETVHLNNGAVLECDLVVTAAGVRPNTIFIPDNSLEMNRGIQVNDCMQTSIPDVFAAGDVTGITGIWPAATKQGKIAAYNMAGKDEHFDDYFSAKNAIHLFGIGTVAIGMPVAPDNSYVEAVWKNDAVYKKIIYKDGIVYGIILQNDVSRSGFWTRVIKEKWKINTSVKNIFDVTYADFFCINEEGEYTFRQQP
ncbi:NAD(P)/FAD-dependent oxidoreductase [Anaeromicropila populeti]|uniref:Pyridine nucleotide-disulphide oxidoreductase n=1 Tax=Anaeromicropila populeti TaxID=37658 RepID=A0A1I6L0N2_9FIRM|nr:FAD-dependent oxidoreductase [Anaeromicropila populeti]SFR96760.1 Pyridine nucleotide-disulphide oxidoreductase [Anaeromicropila populeti]